MALVDTTAGVHFARGHPEPRRLAEGLRYLAICQHCVVQNGTQQARSMGWCLGISSSDAPTLGAVLVSELGIGEY